MRKGCIALLPKHGDCCARLVAKIKIPAWLLAEHRNRNDDTMLGFEFFQLFI